MGLSFSKTEREAQRNWLPGYGSVSTPTRVQKSELCPVSIGDQNASAALLKNHGFIPIQKDAVFHVPADGARQDDFFDVAALLNQIVDRVAVVDADHILFDDGAIVEHLSNVVGGGADQLDAALKRLVVGLGTHERRQERVVNINEVLGAQGGDELIRQHLHVACEDDETALVLADERNLLLFRFPLVFFSDRYDEVRDAVEVGDTLVIGMIGNDQRDFAAKFATLVAVKKVLQAMVILRDEDG